MPSETSRINDPNPTRFLWLVVLAGVIVVFQFAANGWVAYRHGIYDRYGFDLATPGDGVYVKTVFDNGPAAGKLQAGDKVIALDEATDVGQIAWRDLVKYRLRN